MKLYLAVAVLLLAFATQSEAQDAANPGPNIAERFNEFGDTVTEFGEDLAQKTKTAMDQIHQSEFAVRTRDWFSTQLEKMKAKMAELGQ